MSIKKGEFRCPGEIMLLQDKNSNVLFYGEYFWFDTKIINKIEIPIKRNFLHSWNPNSKHMSLRCTVLT